MNVMMITVYILGQMFFSFCGRNALPLLPISGKADEIGIARKARETPVTPFFPYHTESIWNITHSWHLVSEMPYTVEGK